MRKYTGLIVLVLGIALGAAITVFGPEYIEPYLPIAPDLEEGIEAEVVSKRLEQNRLLVTVNASEGATLITFTKKVPEIDLLVEEGDAINLDIRAYKPFINNPKINRVKKPERKAALKPEPDPEQPAEAEGVELPIPEKYKEDPAPKPKPAETKKPAKSPEKPAPEEAAPVTNAGV